MVEGCAFVNTVFVQSAVLSLAHFLSHTGGFFLNAIRPLFGLNKIFRRPERILNRNMIAFFIIILMIKVLDKLINKATVVFERHFIIIIDGDSDLAFRLDQLLLVVELF